VAHFALPTANRLVGMNSAPERIGVAGDWHGNTAWAVNAVRRMSGLLPDDHLPRVIVHLGDFGIWPGPSGLDYLSRLDAVLAATGTELWFVDGNHEDFTRLGQLRREPDGRARVMNSIWHLPRGYRWEWHGRQWLALGGAVSLDRAARVAGRDWWPEEEITRRQAEAVVGAGHADVMVTHECPAGVKHDFGPPPSFWAAEDLRRNEAHRELMRQIVLAVRPGWLMHGHLHRAYQRSVDLGAGPFEITGLDCDTAERGNWGILDIVGMRWLRFQGPFLREKMRAFR
jgi:hypothetical protein